MFENKILGIGANLKKLSALQTHFKKENFSFSMTEDFGNCLDIAKTYRPSIILLYLDSENLEVLRMLRNNDFLNSTPIILIGSKLLANKKMEALTIGADYFFIEAIDVEEVVLCIKNITQRIFSSRWTNPLTALPSNIEINNEIEHRISTKKEFAILYLDLDNFKAYNDVYGFSNGDRLIKFTADIIKDSVKEITAYKENFIGHIGGDDFIAITHPSYSEELAMSIIRKFDKGAADFYSELDRENGYIETTNRLGQKQKFPITTISIAIVSNEKRLLYSPIQIGEIAAELKHHAKSIPGSVYFKDRRRG